MLTKYIAAFFAAFMLASGAATAQTVVTNTTDQLFNAVDEVSTELLVRNRGTAIKIFVNGTYAVGNVVRIQREKGSPGSGSWVNVKTVTATPAAADATVTSTYITKRDRENLRLNMTATGTGAVVAYMTNQTSAPTEFTNTRVYKIQRDDYSLTQTTAVDAQKYVTTENDASGTVCVVSLTVQEGITTCVSGTGDDGLDVVAYSYIDLTDDGALVSDGVMVFETRIAAPDYDGQVGMCLHDEEAVASQLTPFDIDSNVVTFNSANQADAVCIMHQDEATAGTLWQPASAIADAVGNNADEWDGGSAVVDSTYVVLRIELNSAGDAFFYRNGVLFFAEPLAVATTARLVPFLWTNTTTDGAGGATTLNIEYIEFVAARPSS